MEAAAKRLHEDRGMSTHAARLLFECRAFEPLSTLLLDLLSAALLASPTANPALSAASGGYTHGGPLGAVAVDDSAETRASQLRNDAATFLNEWRTSDAAAAAAMGAPLTMMLQVGAISAYLPIRSPHQISPSYLLTLPRISPYPTLLP